MSLQFEFLGPQEEEAATERSLEAFSSDVELLKKLEHCVIPDAAYLYTSGPLKVTGLHVP